jgi:hypothetical protein
MTKYEKIDSIVKKDKAYGEARILELRLYKSCSSLIVISAMGRCLVDGEALKPGGACCLCRRGDVGNVGEVGEEAAMAQ